MKIMECRIRERIKRGLGRKAQIGFNEIMAVAWLLFITGVALSVYFIVHTTLGGSLDTSDVEGNSIADNILFSGAISYYDEDIDRIYPEKVDISKFKSDSLDKSLSYDKPPYESSSGRFTLTNLEDAKSSTIYWSESWFERLKPKSGLGGRGSPNIIETKYIVIAGDENGKEHPNILKEEIIIPRD